MEGLLVAAITNIKGKEFNYIVDTKQSICNFYVYLNVRKGGTCSIYSKEFQDYIKNGGGDAVTKFKKGK